MADRFASRRYSLKKQTCNRWSANDKWFVSVSQINIIICLSLRLRQISDLLATGKSRYFAQPRPIIINCVSEYRDCEQSRFCSKITFLYSPYMAVAPTPRGVYLYFPLVTNEVKSIFASLERKNETFVLRPEIKRTVNAKFRALNANIKSRIFCTHRQNKSRQHKFQMHFLPFNNNTNL